MRIDPKPIAPGTTSVDATDRTDADKRTGKGASSGTSGDSITLSSDAQLLHGALKAAEELPATRADKVAEARLKLASGELGQDAQRLADRIIDSLLER